MCGIIGVLARRSERAVPTADDLLPRLDAAAAALQSLRDDPAGSVGAAADELAAVDVALRGVSGVRALLADAALADRIEATLAEVAKTVADLEAELDEGGELAHRDDLESVNAAVIRLKDAGWAITADRLRTAREVAALAGPAPSVAAVEACWALQLSMSGIDRLEVRGRDSAGLHVLVDGHGLDLESPEIRALLKGRADDPLFTSMAARTPDGRLSLVYKAAAEIGELGDNVKALRACIAGDRLLRRALEADTARVTVLGHTRWASVGIISQPNAHPLNNEELGREGPYVTGALNGDVDNHLDLRAREGLTVPPEITTDAKVIPALVSRRMAEGIDVDEAFRRTVAEFEGSVAIGASAASDPDRLLLALRGSGQALYVGVAEDAFIVASEPYGLVEETSVYLRMDGESAPAGGINGQVVVLDRAGAGTTAGITRVGYDGTPLPVTDDDLQTAAITTRDIDRAGFPHFLLKELTEAPRSFQKTLRGRIEEKGGLLSAHLGDDVLPQELRRRLREGKVARVLAIGQGTAAVAGQSVAVALGEALAGAGIPVTAVQASELSGFGLSDDMSDTVVVAISQSGTTTDTNRTVDLVRARGAIVVAIVNRRNSDLVERSDGVLYNSDGRDVEMAVPSTKAFYAQVAAGFLLAAGMAQETGTYDRHRTHELLAALRELPAAMEKVLESRDDIASAAQRHAPSRRYWAVVGNGPNKVAAQELRIKLSELCYKSIAYDVTEDKKHIDLSSEPMILLCAAGLSGPTADDVAKEVAIYRAHKAAPVVIATEGTSFPAALHTIEVPEVHPALAFVLSAMAGHLFGYEAALAIDAQALPLREARAAIEAATSGVERTETTATVDVAVDATGNVFVPDSILDRLASDIWPVAGRFFEGLRTGAYDGHLEASTATRLAAMFRYATGIVPLDSFELEYGRVGTPSVVVEDLTEALTRGIEELTRPVDAIKHQAKTVTVGISRSEDAFFEVPLVRAVLDAGAGRDSLSYRALRTLAALDPAVAQVVGWTRYRIDGDVSHGTATIHVVDRGGVAREISSRTDRNPALLGTKRRAADEKEVTVARGSDGRTVIHVPETKDRQTVGLTLLHVRFAETLPAATFRDVLSGYRNRYNAIVDAVTEREPVFRDAVLQRIPVVDVLTSPVHVLAEHWR